MDEQGKPERKREGDDVVGEREEKRRKREDDDVGEREEKEGPSQVLPPSCHTEEEEAKNGSDDKLEASSQVMPPSSLFVSRKKKRKRKSVFSENFLLDPPPFGDEIGQPLDPEVSKKYHQQIRESEGFDISFFPGLSLWTPIVPMTGIKKSPSDYEAVVNLAKLAIEKYNIENDEAYEFVDLERVNSEVVSGCIYYITFQVKNRKAAGNGNGNGTVDGDDTPLETFQARVWEGIEKTEVQLCRPKPIKPQN